jgi:hypothetical protein
MEVHRVRPGPDVTKPDVPHADCIEQGGAHKYPLADPVNVL